jgi:hypothetical protein
MDSRLAAAAEKRAALTDRQAPPKSRRSKADEDAK